jgi:hypothetical protein
MPIPAWTQDEGMKDLMKPFSVSDISVFVSVLSWWPESLALQGMVWRAPLSPTTQCLHSLLYSGNSYAGCSCTHTNEEADACSLLDCASLIPLSAWGGLSLDLDCNFKNSKIYMGNLDLCSLKPLTHLNGSLFWIIVNKSMFDCATQLPC